MGYLDWEEFNIKIELRFRCKNRKLSSLIRPFSIAISKASNIQRQRAKATRQHRVTCWQPWLRPCGLLPSGGCSSSLPLRLWLPTRPLDQCSREACSSCLRPGPGARRREAGGRRQSRSRGLGSRGWAPRSLPVVPLSWANS
jgi:hypothetical protein